MTPDGNFEIVSLSYTSPANATFDSGWLYTLPANSFGIAYVENISNITASTTRDECFHLVSSSGAKIHSMSDRVTPFGGGDYSYNYAGVSGCLFLSGGESLKIAFPFRGTTGQLSHVFDIKVLLKRNAVGF